MQTIGDNLLSATRIDKVFPGARALDKVDFHLRRGEVHALLGENGAGKSTLVKCLTGAYRRDGGTILLDGVEIDPRDTFNAQKLGIGTVYQEVNLLPEPDGSGKPLPRPTAAPVGFRRCPRHEPSGARSCLKTTSSTSTSPARSTAIPSPYSRSSRSPAPSISPARC